MELLREVYRNIDHVGENLWSEERPHTPDAKRGRALCAFQIRNATVELRELWHQRIEQVRRLLVEGGNSMSRVAIEEHRAQGGHKHHLVGITDDAVRLLDSGQ